MLIERPPLLYRLLMPQGIWRLPLRDRKGVYFTFDDGPIPEVTPWVLDTLDRYGVKATFFCVGENAHRHPELVAEILARGHALGNHTYNHLQGLKVTTARYLDNVAEAAALLPSRLFRPPHGIMRPKQARLFKQHYSIVMFDLVSRDYSRRLSPEQVLHNVVRYARNGSIIVWHDSLKAQRNVRYALPRAIEWLREHGFEIVPLSSQILRDEQ